MAAAPAVAPAAGISAALIFLCFALIVLYGLLYTYDYTLGAFVRRLADMVEDIWIVGGKLADALERMDHWVMSKIATGIDSLEASVSRLWDGLTWLVKETGDAMVAFAQDVQAAIAGIVGAEIPVQIETRTRVIRERVRTASLDFDARMSAEARARGRGIDQLRRDLAREQLARERGIDRLTERISDFVMPRVRAVEGELADVWGYTRRHLLGRIRSLENALAAGAVAGIAAAALTRLYPWWQCTNVRRFNRLLCRAPIGALDDLLGLALTVVGPISLVAFAELLQGVTPTIAAAVDEWIVED